MHFLPRKSRTNFLNRSANREHCYIMMCLCESLKAVCAQLRGNNGAEFYLRNSMSLFSCNILNGVKCVIICFVILVKSHI